MEGVGVPALGFLLRFRRRLGGGLRGRRIDSRYARPGEHGVKQFLFQQFFFRRRDLLAQIVVVAVAGAAADFCGFAFHQRNNRVIRQAAAFDAIIVDDVSEPYFAHYPEYIIRNCEALILRYRPQC